MFAIDASSHHGKVTDARAERIRKHYAAKLSECISQLSLFSAVTYYFLLMHVSLCALFCQI